MPYVIMMVKRLDATNDRYNSRTCKYIFPNTQLNSLWQMDKIELAKQ